MRTKQLDIVQVVERRRKWPPETKARIMEEALAPGTTIASVANRHGVARSQVYGWFRKARTGKLPGVSMASAACAGFVPVKIEEPVAVAAAPSLLASGAAAATRRRTSVVEIALGNGRTMKVDEEIDPVLLARLAGVLDGGKR